MQTKTQSIEADLSEDEGRNLIAQSENLLRRIQKNPRYEMIGNPALVKGNLKRAILWQNESSEPDCHLYTFDLFGNRFVYFPTANFCFLEKQNTANYPHEYKNDLLRDIRSWQRIGKRMHLKTPRISFVSVSLATSCNLACAYCFNDRGSYGIWRPQLLSNEKAKEIVSYVRNSSRFSSLVNMNLFGGEPLLNFDALRTIVSELKCSARGKNSIYLSITTNGTIFSKEIVEFLNSHVAQITVSMVPTREGQNSVRPKASGAGSYAKLLASLRGWPHALRTRTSLAVTWAGDWCLEAFEDFCREWGFKRVMVSLVQGTSDQQLYGNALTNSFEAYYNKRIGNFSDSDVRITTPIEEAQNIQFGYPITRACGAGSSIAAIDIEGNVNGCYLFQHRRELSPGSVAGERLASDKLFRFRELVDPQKALPCSACRSLNVCGGDCGYNREYNEKAFLRCDYLRRMSDLKLALIGSCTDEDVAHVRRLCDDSPSEEYVF